MTRFSTRLAETRRAIHLFGGRRLVEDHYGPKRRCVYCGGKPQTRDHVLPMSRGGLDHLSNLVPACRACNGMKGNMTPQRFFSRYTWAAAEFAKRAVHADPAWLALATTHGKRNRCVPNTEAV